MRIINHLLGLLSDDFYDATDLSATPNKATPIDYLSDSDSDSFISATQSLDNVSHTHRHTPNIVNLGVV